MIKTTTIGEQAENDAERYLIEQGLKPIQRNFRSKLGEIDLIMRDANSLVFVEVRCRKNHYSGGAAESVDMKKQRKLTKTAQYYLAWHPEYANMACRFDVVCIQLDAAQKLTWIHNAFDMIE